MKLEIDLTKPEEEAITRVRALYAQRKEVADAVAAFLAAIEGKTVPPDLAAKVRDALPPEPAAPPRPKKTAPRNPTPQNAAPKTGLKKRGQLSPAAKADIIAKFKAEKEKPDFDANKTITQLAAANQKSEKYIREILKDFLPQISEAKKE